LPYFRTSSLPVSKSGALGASALVSTPFRSIEPRYIGFLNANRSLLAMGAIAASGLLTSIPSVPASADMFQVPTETIPVQTFTAPNVVASPVLRDGFGITTYAVVQWPVALGTTISSGYGYRSCAGCTANHTGMDFTPGNGAPVQAVADGVVTEAGYSYDYGVHVIIQHDLDGEIVSTLYAHLQDGSMPFGVGEAVARGTQLGLVGQTGIATGPHLHFAVMYGGEFVEPASWLQAHVNI
jgi:murein DD-endopeptidase MepM/ murein hydrolase activator NlpD